MPERSSKIRQGKIADWSQQNRQGMLETPGPFLGIVKWNVDPTRAGRLQVFIPDLGNSDPDDSAGWYTVSYASPFRGKTQGNVTDFSDYAQDGDYPQATAEEENCFQSYGMWFVPPDIGVTVLCLFVNSDPAQGYWFACINNSYDSYMTPGMGSAPAASDTGKGGYIWNPAQLATHQKLQQYIELPTGEIPSRLPVTEATRNAQDTADGAKIDNLDNIVKYPLVYQTLRLGMQGLCFDFSRGTTSTTSIRESPSWSYGISTPGRWWCMSDQQKSQDFIQNGDPDTLLKNFRVGGHQFVLDDGTSEGLDQAIKIRTSKGNMILLDDSNEQIYIINSQGTAWIELSPSGRIDVYAQNDFSLRSQGNINLHTEKDFRVHARGNINFKSEGTVKWQSQGTCTIKSDSTAEVFSAGTLNLGTNSTLNLFSQGDLSAKSNGEIIVRGGMIYLNTKPGVTVTEPPDLEEIKHPKTAQVGGRKTWWVEGEFKSIVTRAPDHEPWKNHEVFTVRAVTPSPAASSRPVGIRPNSEQ
jgi:hypothetical protein